MHLVGAAGNTYRAGSRHVSTQARSSAAIDRDLAQSIALGCGVVLSTKSRAEQLMTLRDDWLKERPLVRSYGHAESGDPRLPSVVVFIEGGREITRNKGRSELDAIAQALAVLAAGAA
jgi:hypothetical protein